VGSARWERSEASSCGSEEAVFVQASTSEIYGDAGPPRRGTGATSAAPARARSDDEAKRYGEAMVSAFRASPRRDTRSVRISTPMARGLRAQRRRVVPAL